MTVASKELTLSLLVSHNHHYEHNHHFYIFNLPEVPDRRLSTKYQSAPVSIYKTPMIKGTNPEKEIFPILSCQIRKTLQRSANKMKHGLTFGCLKVRLHWFPQLPLRHIWINVTLIILVLVVIIIIILVLVIVIIIIASVSSFSPSPFCWSLQGGQSATDLFQFCYKWVKLNAVNFCFRFAILILRASRDVSFASFTRGLKLLFDPRLRTKSTCGKSEQND